MRYYCDKAPVTIDIDLPVGAYSLGHQSSTGKSKLAEYLKLLNRHNEPVYAITYRDSLEISSIKEKIPKDCKVIMLDRYDLYLNKYHSDIQSLSETAVVLIDTKVEPDIGTILNRARVGLTDKYTIKVR